MPSHPTRYTLDLTEDDKIFIRFRSEKGIIKSFTVQYATKIQQRWRTVRRYDTAHSLAHIDIYSVRKKGKVRQIPILGEYGNILTDAIDEVRQDYQLMKEYFFL